MKKAIIFLMICISVAGYLFNKRIARSILKVIGKGKVIANGNFSDEIEITDDDEIGELSDSFNRVTRRLRQNIDELKESKKLIQDILSRVGSAVTSMRDIDSLLELIVQVVTNALSGESGCLMLIDEKKEELFIKVAYRLDSGLMNKKRSFSTGTARP